MFYCRESNFMFSNIFSRRLYRVWDVKKMPCCISTSKVVTRTHHIVFYVLSLLVYFCVLFLWSDLWSWSNILTSLLYVLFFLVHTAEIWHQLSYVVFSFVRFIKQSCLRRVVSCSLFRRDDSSIHKAKIGHFQQQYLGPSRVMKQRSKQHFRAIGLE
jgi:hypothetical protein